MANGQIGSAEPQSSSLDLIEFTLDRLLPDGSAMEANYGVNVAKVREVVRLPAINPLAAKIKGIAGLFELRGVPIPAIDLAQILGDASGNTGPSRQIIVTEFSKKRAGFIVKTTKRIRRIQWDKILPAPATKDVCLSGMCLIEDNKFLYILDLEKILLDLEGESSEYQGLQNSLELPQPSKNFTILLVDDSSIILSNTTKILRREGYQVIATSNGEGAKKILADIESGKQSNSKIDLIVTDIEMPKLDGLSLTKYVKGTDLFKNTPVVVHTSLSGNANVKAATSVGADGYIIKNDFQELLKAIGSYYEKRFKV